MTQDAPSAEILAFREALSKRAVAKAPTIQSTIRGEVPDAGATDWLKETPFPLITVTKDPGDTRALFRVSRQLGEGGAGAVYLAEQTTLHRDVALKSPLSVAGQAATPTSVERGEAELNLLLREARIMGYLEHPGIVPIHLVGRDGNGNPFVVMKRIEGETLEERLNGLDRQARAAQRNANLEVIIDVCQALAYAHSRGIVHRDIKPANVMTGAFGEVYLLDWGIAVAFKDGVPRSIPRANAEEVVGTPAFMAPEMVNLSHPPGPKTDIYLMGGLLYFMLTGEVPHDGKDSPMAAFFLASQSEPKIFDSSVPAELGEICNRAMARYPADRYASIEAFRQAIISFREREAAQDLAERGWERTAELRRLLAAGILDNAQVYSVFGAARQALEESIRQWPDGPTARNTLQEALELLIEFELERDNPGAAMRLLEDLPRPNPALAARVEPAFESFQRGQQEVEELRREMDPKVAGRAKAKFWFGIALAVAVPQLLPQLLGVQVTALSLVGGQVALVVLLAAICFVFRKRLFTTRLNRLLVTSVWMPILLALMMRVGVYFGAGTIAFALAADLTMVALLGIYIVINIDSRLLFGVPGYVLGAVAAMVWPAYAPWIFPLTHLISLTAVGIYHLLGAEPDAAPRGV
ncbi:serine/threonine-protein kinase [Bradymonas sediminis]|uniref:Protein kinase domain-containing protein n=1 Tax=Bradymonas sediminis TaxID=1548548 RepID=A0A2Z4FN25_9DELT|nr:serine/threonine-protein kinase [Bradymonas sediminis]AWV90333.1 hypothetical protein DN745_13740 [Bradymonas sediminis]TDP75690.1 serine/threonine-protein kinase [Bradymonas sediminis]